MQAFIEVIFEIILRVVFEIGLRLPGTLICKCLMPKSEVNLDSFRVILVGLLFWSIIGFGFWRMCS